MQHILSIDTFQHPKAISFKTCDRDFLKRQNAWKIVGSFMSIFYEKKKNLNKYQAREQALSEITFMSTDARNYEHAQS